MPPPSPTPPRVQRITPCAILALGLVVTAAATYAQTPPPAQAARPQSFNIPPGPLGETLTRYASAAGVAITFSAVLTEGLQSPGVNGSHTLAQGFAQLLHGSGLEARQTGQARYTLIQQNTAEPHANENHPASTTLATIEVVGKRPATASEGTGSYAAHTTTIGRRAQTLREIPQSVSVITRQRLDDQNLNSLEQALQHTPGITVSVAQSGAAYDFYARGFAINNVSFDGVQMVTGFGGFDVQPDTATVDRLEVLRGADGLYSGAGQPGGSVNIVRKRPLTRRQTALNLAAGAWAHTRAEFDHSQPLNTAGSIRARSVLAWQRNDFFFHAPRADRRSAYGVLETDLGARTTLGFGLNWQKADSPVTIGHPRTVDGRDLGLPRRRSFTSPWTYYNFETSQVFADLQHAFNSTWHLRANASWLKENNAFKYNYLRGSYDPASGNGLTMAGIAGRYGSRQYGLDASLEGAFHLFSRRHGLSIGASHIERATPSFTREGWHFPEDGMPVSLDFNPDTIPEPAYPHMRKTSEANTRQSGLYGVARWSLIEATTLITGARVTWFDYESRNLVSGAINSQYQQNAQITPYAGIVWALHPRYSLYASYSDIFRPQSNQYQANGIPLDPAIGANYEIGLKTSAADERLNGAFALFRIEETNRSQPDPAWPTACPGNPGGGACYINAGEVRSQGVEAELNGEIVPGWHWFSGYTWNTTRYLRDVTSQGRPFRSTAPKHLLRLYTRYTLPGDGQRWALSAGVNVQSKIYTGSTLVVRQAGYALWNAGISYTVNPHLALHLSANNLFDKVYYRRINTGAGNMHGEPRNVMLTARMKF